MTPYTSFGRTLVTAAMVLSTGVSLGMPAATAPEFGGQCVEGLSEGRHVATNCATTWTDKDGKTYCFSSEGAKKSFLEHPAENLQRAHSFMAAGNVESTEKAMQNYTGTDAENLVKDTINAKLKANNGVFPYDDPLTGDHLKLSYDDVDLPVRSTVMAFSPM